jgi:hypothetical protein
MVRGLTTWYYAPGALGKVDGITPELGDLFAWVSYDSCHAYIGVWEWDGDEWISREDLYAVDTIIQAEEGTMWAGTQWRCTCAEMGMIAWMSGWEGLDAVNVRAATIENITLSGEQTIDDSWVEDGELVLVRCQTDATENGVWIVRTGAWERAAVDLHQGLNIGVADSTYTSGFFRLLTADPITPGVTALSFGYVDGGRYYDYTWNNAHVATTEAVVLSGLQTIDGHAVLNNEVVLVKDQADPAENGLYYAHAGAWVRTPDQFFTGQAVYVGNGTQAGDWLCTITEPFVVGSTELAFEAAP